MLRDTATECPGNPVPSTYTWGSRGPAIDGDLGLTVAACGAAVADVAAWKCSAFDLLNGSSMSSPSVAGGLGDYEIKKNCGREKKQTINTSSSFQALCCLPCVRVKVTPAYVCLSCFGELPFLLVPNPSRISLPWNRVLVSFRWWPPTSFYEISSGTQSPRHHGIFTSF